MWSKHPEIAKKWAHGKHSKKKKKYGTYSKESIEMARSK